MQYKCRPILHRKLWLGQQMTRQVVLDFNTVWVCNDWCHPKSQLVPNIA